ncbi:unnamed protein product [Pylaiella littoralis]
MVYFIGNGTATIGGGSLGRTEQLPTLKLLCVDLCARHLDRLSDLGDIPIEVFIDLLQRAKEKATPVLVKRFQEINQRLRCKEVDIAFWKQAVEGHILRRTVPAPGPVLVERVNSYKERLKALNDQAIAPSATGNGGNGNSGEKDKEWSQNVTKILEALRETPVSMDLLRETLIGKVVSRYRKSADTNVARTATELVRRWKEVATPRGEGAGASATAAVSGGGGGGGGGGVLPERRAAAGEGEKQRAVEEGFRCRTWESLFQHLELLRAEKVRASSKRAREAREREQQNRPKMIVGKSQGENLTRKIGRTSGKSCAPSFFAPSAPPTSSSSSSAASASASSPPSLARGGGRSPFFSPKKSAKTISSPPATTATAHNKKKNSSRSGSNSSSSSIKSRGGGSGRASGSGGRSGGGGGSVSSAMKRKGDHYTSGVMSVAELRRKVVHNQRLSVPVKPRETGGGAVGAAAAASLSPPKRSKFWK